MSSAFTVLTHPTDAATIGPTLPRPVDASVVLRGARKGGSGVGGARSSVRPRRRAWGDLDLWCGFLELVFAAPRVLGEELLHLLHLLHCLAHAAPAR